MGETADQALRKLLDFEPPRPEIKLFVVDDEDVICHVLARLLADVADDLQTFVTGDAALEAILANPPAVVVTDKNLPDLSGMELIRLGKEQNKDTEFIIITGFASLDNAIEVMDLGAFGYLKKPFSDLEQVKAKVVAATERYRAVAQNRLLEQHIEDSYMALYKAKAELEMHDEITNERLRLGENELRSLLETLVAPLGGLTEELSQLAEFIAKVETGEHRAEDCQTERARLEMIAGRLNQTSTHSKSIVEDSSDQDRDEDHRDG